MAISLVMMAASLCLNYLLVGAGGMEGAAAATTIASFIGMAMASAYVLNRFKSVVEIRSLANILLASAAVALVGSRFMLTGWTLLAEYAALTALYLGLLAALREIKEHDLRLVKNFIPGHGG
jgi:O-antigen/teichoic acid export membrane protein